MQMNTHGFSKILLWFQPIAKPTSEHSATPFAININTTPIQNNVMVAFSRYSKLNFSAPILWGRIFVMFENPRFVGTGLLDMNALCFAAFWRIVVAYLHGWDIHRVGQQIRDACQHNVLNVATFVDLHHSANVRLRNGLNIIERCAHL
jgi:hypothetical protein